MLVGDASVFAKQLAGAGFDQFERVPLADLDLAAADFRRHATPSGRFEAPIEPAFGGSGARLEPASYQTTAAPPRPQPLHRPRT